MTMGWTYASHRIRARSAEGARRAAGLSLVELLVVLGIIGIISAVLVPVAIRNGWFTASKSAFAARDLFTMLKAASVYAGTYNVDTAVAYAGRLVDDSETGVENVPVVDRLVLARRLSREEIVALNKANAGLDYNGEYYVPIVGPEGVFRPLPEQTCLLPDFFQVEQNPTTNQYYSVRGLRGIQLYDLDAQAFLEPRAGLDYALDSLPLSFPAHTFKPDGSMRVDPSFTRQRFNIRAGVLLNETFGDRFYVNSDFPPDPVPIPIVFDEFDGNTPLVADVFLSSDPVDIDDKTDLPEFADIDAVLELFVATGRVRMGE